jgi:excisionase family DNA binding protein
MDIIETIAKQPGLLSGPRVARLLGLDKKTVARMARENRIPHLRLGGRTRFNPQAVAGWLLAAQQDGQTERVALEVK